jgi:hypothetical protein
MAEVQTNTQSGEMTQRFIEFVMMQAQNAALFLGQIPHPQSGQPEVNLEAARMFIDQLAMIQEKTRGNLTTEETTVLRNALSSLQMAFVEAAEGKQPGDAPAPAETAEAKSTPEPPGGQSGAEPSVAPPSAAAPEAESKKKFSKSYGS